MFQTLFRTPIHALALSGFLISGMAVSQPAYAAGEGSSGVKKSSSKKKARARKAPSCKRRHVWDKRRKKCVRARRSSQLSDDNIYEAGRELAYSKRYEEAITVLKLAKNQQDPRILNFLGFSTRKSGDVEKGLGYYRAAIKANPDYTLARSYMGEAYLQLGDRKNALAQLVEIKARCAGVCPEYSVLKAAIEGKKLKSKATW